MVTEVYESYSMEDVATFDGRAKIAKIKYPEIKNGSERVRQLEIDLGLDPFKPIEIINQRRKEGYKKSGALFKACKVQGCEGTSFARFVCPKCPDYQPPFNYRTEWRCNSCGDILKSKFTVSQWTQKIYGGSDE